MTIGRISDVNGYTVTVMVSYYEYDEDDFPDYMVIEHYPDDYYDDDDDLITNEPTWTLRRVIMLLVAILMLGSMVLAYDLLPAIQIATDASQGPPTPVPPPPALI